MISRLRSSRPHSSWITAAIRRSTPRVRWNLSSVDQSPKSWSNSSGWIGYDAFEPPLVLALAALGREVGLLRAYSSPKRWTTASRSRSFSGGDARTAGAARSRSPPRRSRASTTPPCRPTTFEDPLSACRPPSPPTSMSEAGIETTSIAFVTSRAASVSACANVNCVSNVPAGRSSCAVELARVRTHSSIRIRHGAVRESSSTSACPGSCPCGRPRRRARSPPCRRAARRARPTASAPRSRRPSDASSPGCELVPDEHGPLRRRRRLEPASASICSTPGSCAGG